MALLPMGLPADLSREDGAEFGLDTQESMFEEPGEPVAEEKLHSYESGPAYEAQEDFHEEVPALNSYRGGTDPLAGEPMSEPAVEVPAEETPQVAEPASATTAPPKPTADDFSGLEERVLRAVALVRSERQARLAAEERVTVLQAQLHQFEAQLQEIEAQSPVLERLLQEVEALRIERDQVRQRVERLLGQLDALEL